jgi:alpha-aminoadipate carrier protein LysW
LPTVLDAAREENLNINAGRVCERHFRPKINSEEAMVLCPECESDLDVEEDELDEGEILSCTECGSDFEVVGVEPLELTKVGEDEDDEDASEAKEVDEDGDY